MYSKYWRSLFEYIGIGRGDTKGNGVKVFLVQMAFFFIKGRSAWALSVTVPSALRKFVLRQFYSSHPE
ncbi:hypothetical protein ACTXT7_004801 [Hymenolepis weldensis]